MIRNILEIVGVILAIICLYVTVSVMVMVLIVMGTLLWGIELHPVVLWKVATVGGIVWFVLEISEEFRTIRGNG